MAVKNNIKLIFCHLKLNLSKAAQYKTSFAMQIIMMVANNAFFILQWLIIFQVTESIGGYGFKEIMLLWALSAGCYGVCHLFFNGVNNIGNLVYEGRLDVFLTQPKRVLINVATSSSSVSAIGDIIYSFIALILAGAAWWWYIAIIPVMIIGGIMYASLLACFQTLSFYIKKGNAISDTISGALTNFANYPPVIFDIVSKVLLYTIIPCGFMIFIPAQYLFLSFNGWLLLASLGFTIVITILAFVLFNKGLKRYSSGSLMGGRF